MNRKHFNVSMYLIFALLFASAFTNFAHADFATAMQSYNEKHYAEAMAEFKRSAVLGHKPSQYNLGIMYLHGEGTEKNLIEAFAWFAIAAADNEAARASARDHVMSLLDEKNKDIAIDRMQSLFTEMKTEAAKIEPVMLSREKCTYSLKQVKFILPEYPRTMEVNGQQNIADVEFGVDKHGAARDFSVIYTTNHQFDKSIFSALRKWRFAPVTIDGRPVEVVSARIRMTFTFGGDLIEPEKIKQYANDLRRDAESNDLGKMFGAAYIADLVRELNIDKQDTNTWYYKAAQGGFAPAEYQIGKSLFLGDGCVQDTHKGLQWLTMAAEERSLDAQYFLGVSLLGSDKISEERTKAIEWLKKAASGHNEKAMMRLAWILATDKDEKVRDPARALALVKEVYQSYADILRSNETLAAAQAANGMFEEAVKSQTAALKEAKSISYPLDEVKSRLAAYQNEQLWLE